MVNILFIFSVLKTFVYDPLVEWGERRHRDTATAAAKEVSYMIIMYVVSAWI